VKRLKELEEEFESSSLAVIRAVIPLPLCV